MTPLVRKLAADKGVDLSALTGTGVGGRIRKQDVLEAAEKAAAAKAAAAAAAPPAAAAAAGRSRPPSRQPSPLRGRTEKLTRIRATIARRMVESLQVSAQLTTVVEVDVTRIARLRHRGQGRLPGQARREAVVPAVLRPGRGRGAAGAPDGQRLDRPGGRHGHLPRRRAPGHRGGHPKGLIVPVIRDAGDLNLAGLAKRIADVAERTRANKISPDELSGGTFTLTNTGSRGALFDTPIINQPQVGILGTGAVVKRAVVVDDPEPGRAHRCRGRWSTWPCRYDHRLVDGADAARFLVTMKERLEGGQFEAELGL